MITDYRKRAEYLWNLIRVRVPIDDSAHAKSCINDIVKFLEHTAEEARREVRQQEAYQSRK